MKKAVSMFAALVFIASAGAYGADTEGSLLDQSLDVFFETSEPAFFDLEDGVLTSVLSEDRGFIVLKDSYDNFSLSVEYWAEPETNSGIFVRCQDPAKFSSRTCYEVNISDAPRKPGTSTGAVLNYVTPSVEIDTAEQWVTMTVLADGDHIVVTVDGQTTADFHDDTYVDGLLALQYGGSNKRIKFRNLQITPISAP